MALPQFEFDISYRDDMNESSDIVSLSISDPDEYCEVEFFYQDIGSEMITDYSRDDYIENEKEIRKFLISECEKVKGYTKNEKIIKRFLLNCISKLDKLILSE